MSIIIIEFLFSGRFGKEENISCLMVSTLYSYSNSYLTNGFSHHYHLGVSTFILRDIGSDFEILFHF